MSAHAPRSIDEYLKQLRAALEGELIDAADHQPRVAVGLLPELWIEILEQCPDGPVPAEIKVAGELGKPRESRGNDRSDF